ncbi:MAG: DUF3040 domain-containing protein [Acidothermus sp.]|nr:DUF3040 domain-containing protein [Acidothermus sp.]MCL6537610.1 DUF3040 domain-containing protein [Acidothermus sp.]
MPLSEHEQRVLEEIERTLSADDPKFAATVRSIDPRIYRRRRLLRSAIAGILGALLVPVGILIRQYEIAVLGILVAIGALLYAGAIWRRRARGVGRPKPPRRRFLHRMEERWDRRRENPG